MGRMTKPHRRRLFRLFAVALGLLPLVVIESTLRITETSSPTWGDPSIRVDSQPALFVLDESGERYQIDPARSNYFQPASFSANKKATTRRVFVLGGSTVQGRPYAPETAFSTWLKIWLTTCDDRHDYEVVNCGGVSYASYRVAKILDEVLTHQPDAVVLYTGHNEFLENRTYADRRNRGVTAKAIDSLAEHLRTVRWAQNKFAPPARKGHSLAPEVSVRLDNEGGLESYRRDGDWRTGVETDFRDSFAGMLANCETTGVPLIVCLPACDLIDTPPFKSAVDPALSSADRATCTSLWQTLQSDATFEEKQRACRELLALDPKHAGANFWTGREMLDSRQDTRLARQHLITARDEDVCPLRATTTIIRTVRELTDKRFPLVDTPSLFDDDDDALPETRWFVDHIHPSIAGHQRIAASLAERFAGLGWIQIDDGSRRRVQTASGQYFETLGEEYFHRGRQRLRGLQQWAAGRAGMDLDE